MPFGHRHLLPRALPQLYERQGEPKELFPGGCEGRASFIPNEKRSPKLLFKQAHPRADCRLTDIQALGSPDETATEWTIPATPKGGTYNGDKLTFTVIKAGGTWQIDSVTSNAKVGP